MEKDDELKAIVEIEMLIESLRWEQKYRVLDFVKARVIPYDTASAPLVGPVKDY